MKSKYKVIINGISKLPEKKNTSFSYLCICQGIKENSEIIQENLNDNYNT